MGSALNSIAGLFGPPVTMIPFGAYINGTFNPTTVSSFGIAAGGQSCPDQTIANFGNYRGALIQVVLQRPQGTEENNVQIIPHHGPCPDFVTHDPYGSDWGWKVNGKANATAGVGKTRCLYIDMDRSMSHLSVEVTVQNMDAGLNTCLLGVTAIPVMPKDTSGVPAFADNDLIELFGGADIDFTTPASIIP